MAVVVEQGHCRMNCHHTYQKLRANKKIYRKNSYAKKLGTTPSPPSPPNKKEKKKLSKK